MGHSGIDRGMWISSEQGRGPPTKDHIGVLLRCCQVVLEAVDPFWKIDGSWDWGFGFGLRIS